MEADKYPSQSWIAPRPFSWSWWYQCDQTSWLQGQNAPNRTPHKLSPQPNSQSGPSHVHVSVSWLEREGWVSYTREVYRCAADNMWVPWLRASFYSNKISGARATLGNTSHRSGEARRLVKINSKQINSNPMSIICLFWVWILGSFLLFCFTFSF